jgi:hypothetical protein
MKLYQSIPSRDFAASLSSCHGIKRTRLTVLFCRVDSRCLVYGAFLGRPRDEHNQAEQGCYRTDCDAQFPDTADDCCPCSQRENADTDTSVPVETADVLIHGVSPGCTYVLDYNKAPHETEGVGIDGPLSARTAIPFYGGATYET